MANMLPIIKKIIKNAVESEIVTGVPAELTTAQCILESGWLKFCPGNNCFGIKEYPGCFGRQLLPTKEWFNPTELRKFLNLQDGRIANETGKTSGERAEYRVLDWFATFENLSDCFTKHGDLFNKKPYKDFLNEYKQTGDLKGFIGKVGKVYATSPIYADVVMNLINRKDVKKEINDARNTSKTESNSGEIV